VYYSIDTETCGLDEDSGIIELAAVELTENRQFTGRTYHILVNPDTEIDPEASRVHGFYYNTVKKFPLATKELLLSFIELIGEGILVGHSLAFDVAHINHLLGRLNLPLLEVICPTEWICTWEYAEAAWPDERHSLSKTCELEGVPCLNAHSALYDAYSSAYILQKIKL